MTSCNACNEGSDVTNGLLDLGAVRIPITNRLDNYSYTFTKPGKYKIKLLCGYNGMYSRTHDSVITVRDTTIFQAFPTKYRNSYSSNKYAMTQDAEGYYLDFANEEANVQLYDNVGRLVKSYLIKDAKYIRKEELERGVYFLQINVNGEVYHEKVLVE